MRKLERQHEFYYASCSDDNYHARAAKTSLVLREIFARRLQRASEERERRGEKCLALITVNFACVARKIQMFAVETNVITKWSSDAEKIFASGQFGYRTRDVHLAAKKLLANYQRFKCIYTTWCI